MFFCIQSFISKENSLNSQQIKLNFKNRKNGKEN